MKRIKNADMINADNNNNAHKAAHFSAHNLCVGYNGKSVVKDIDVDVKSGEILTLIGPNGAGKSTILKTITRQLAVVGGVVMIDGKQLNRIDSKELASKMSVVLTERVEPELMTCRDVVSLGRYPYTDSFGKMTSKDRQIVQDSLAKVNGLELADKHFDSISDGQRQRIMLARALCQQPDIMVLDEPTSYLDIRYKADFFNIFKKMSDDGITIIMSLHEIDYARRLSDRIMCVRDDGTVTVGTAEQIFTGDTIDELFGLEKGAYRTFFEAAPQTPDETLDLEQVIKGIRPACEKRMEDTRKHLDNIAKPLKSLGMLEDVLVRLGGADALKPSYNACVVVMCADNGVVAEGVSQTGSEVTAKVAFNMTRCESSVCLMADTVGIPVFPYDIGMITDVLGVPSIKKMYGTNDFCKGPAMTRETAQSAILSGIEAAVSMYKAGYNMIATGEMGIGNTTTSSAVVSVLTGLDAAEVTGRGAGLSDEGLKRKIQVIKQGIELNRPDAADVTDVVSKVGGLDIAGMAGVFIGAAYCGIPAVIDGFISSAAALVAYRLAPACRDYMIASHMSKEAGAQAALKELGLTPLMSMGMALGEGTGAVSVIPLINMAANVCFKMPTFGDIGMEAYEDYDKR